MAEKISVEIELDGGEQVESQLNDIGKTGNQAFAETAKAADRATESVSNFSLQTVKTSLEIAKLTAEIAKVGVEIGLAVTKHRGLISQLIHLASSANTATKALGLIAPELAAMGTGLAAVGVALAGAAIAFEVVEKAATKAAKGYEELNHSLQTLASNTGQSFNSLQRGRAAFEQLGVSGEKFNDIITKISEATASFDVGAKLKESADKALEAEKALLEAQLKVNSVATIGNEAPAVAAQRLLEINRQLSGVASDREKAEEAASANAKALANNLSAIIPIVKQIEEGQKGIKFDQLTTAATKIDAVTASMKQAETVGRNAGQVLVNFIASADRLSAVKVGAAFGITEADVDRIRNLGGQLNIVDQIWQRIQGAGVLIPPESAAAFDRMRVSVDGVASAKARLDQAMSSSFFAALAADASSSLNSIKADLINLAAATVETFNTSTSAMSDMFANTTRELISLGEALAGMLSRWREFRAASAPLPEPGGIPQMAGGGLLGGAGTGTSDSNLAWVSRGEYITPARAVAQPGVLGFLEALRRSGGNLSRVLDGMGRFALGGMVPRMPAFAAGGLAGGSNVTIQFPGLPAIGGLRASANVVDQLHRAAALAQVRSGGRKPSRYS